MTKFYSNRFLSAFLAILLFTVCYFIYIKLLADPFGITDIARIVIWAMTGIAFILGMIYTIKTFDPKPVVEMMPEGMIIRTFLFREDFVPWAEVSGVEQKQHTQHVLNMAGYIKVTTSFFRIYRPVGQPLAINLTLLNKRGNKFMNTISAYLENPVNHMDTNNRGISDERLLKKFHQSIKKDQKLAKTNFSSTIRVISLIFSLLILTWLLNYFRTLDFNLIIIIGFIVVFFIIWGIMLFITEFFNVLITNPKDKKVKIDHQIEVYRKMIRARVELENIDFECILSLPIIKINDAYFEEVEGDIYFSIESDKGQIEQIILPKENINVRYDQENLAYRIYAEKAVSGIFKNEQIGHYHELNIPR